MVRDLLHVKITPCNSARDQHISQLMTQIFPVWCIQLELCQAKDSGGGVALFKQSLPFLFIPLVPGVIQLLNNPSIAFQKNPILLQKKRVWCIQLETCHELRCWCCGGLFKHLPPTIGEQPLCIYGFCGFSQIFSSFSWNERRNHWG